MKNGFEKIALKNGFQRQIFVANATSDITLISSFLESLTIIVKNVAKKGLEKWLVIFLKPIKSVGQAKDGCMVYGMVDINK